MGVPWQSLIILGYDFREVVRRVGEFFELDADAIRIPGKQSQRAHARSLACFGAVRESGMTAVASRLMNS
jgi:hypothetical protein